MIEHLLEEIVGGEVRSVAFVIPWGAVWSLPAYELALLTAAHLRERGVKDVDLTLVTPEAEPLQLFGPPASEAVHALLDERGVRLRPGHTQRSSQTENSNSSQTAASSRTVSLRFHGFRAPLSTGCLRPWTASFRSTRIAGCTASPTSSPRVTSRASR